MSTEVGSIHYNLDLDTKKFDSQASGVSSKLKDLGKGMTDIGKKMTMAITLPVGIGLGFAIKAASDLNETLNKVDVAFGANSANVKKWAENSINSMGLAKGSALDAAATFGDMSTAMGLSTGEAEQMATSLVQLGGDLSSFKNISFREAQTALAGVFTGETESLKHLGIIMTETNLEQFALTEGITKNISEMTQAEKVQLRYAYIMNATKNAQGDFARTAGGSANQMRITQEKFKQLSAEIGARFLPILNQALGYIQKAISYFQKLSPKQQDMIVKFVLLAAALGPVLMILGQLIPVISMLWNPVTLIIIAVAALVAGVIYLQKKFQLFTPVIDFLKSTLRSLVELFNTYLLPSLKAIWNNIQVQLVPTLMKLWETFMRLWNALSPGLVEVLKIVGAIIGIAIIAYIWIFINVINVMIKTTGFAIHIFSVLINWISNVIQWFGNAIVAIGNFVGNTIIFFSNFNVGMHQFYNLTVQKIQQVIQWFVNLKNNMIRIFVEANTALYNAGRNVITSLGRGIASMASFVWNSIKGVADQIGGFFRGAWDWLYGAGRAIIEGLTRGIKSVASAPVNAVKDVVRNVRDYLPFSPAKKGPFSGKGWTLYSGQSMMTGLATGIKQMSSQPQDAFASALQGMNATQNNTSSMSIYGNINIADRPTADYWFNRLDRNQQLTGLGMSPQ